MVDTRETRHGLHFEFDWVSAAAGRTHAARVVIVEMADEHLAQAASPGTAFTYQGKLFVGDVPANGLYDLQFSNYDAAAGGSALGAFNTNALPVTNGLFTVTLDFGAVFDGTPRWLEISERTNGVGAFGTLAFALPSFNSWRPLQN